MNSNQPATSSVVQVDEFYELEVGSDVADSAHYNEDIAPTKISIQG